MFGHVDLNGRPMLRVTFSDSSGKSFINTDAIVDTGCQFAAILPRANVAALALPFSHFIIAKLADGGTARLDVYAATIDWFGGRRAIMIAESGVQTPLLGTALLSPHLLIIDYAQRTVEIR